MSKVLILGDSSYESAFDPNEFICMDRPWIMPDNDMHDLIDHADLICFTGGEDVHPNEYGQLVEADQPDFMFDQKRDAYEKVWYRRAKSKNKPCVGICRGAQFLNVMNGGRLVQDVAGHHTSHTAYSYTNLANSYLQVSSDHHNIMIPTLGSELLLYALEGSDYAPPGAYEALPPVPGHNVTIGGPPRIDPEVLLYRLKKDLCHQPHPEWVAQNSPYWNYFNFTVRRLLEL